MNCLVREQQGWVCDKMGRKFHLDFIKKYYSESTILFIKTIAHRVYRYNKNALIITCGASGSGKSYIDLELLRGVHAYVHGEFPPDEEVINRCFFKLKDFLAILNTEEMQNQKKSRGQMFISEEAGTQASNRTHQNIANRTYSYIVQTFRAKGMIIFFNVPSFNFIDSQVRKQLHYLIETKTIDVKRKTCIAKPLELQYNSRMDKLYYHNITAETDKNEWLSVDLIDIPKIPDSLEILYEKKKTDFINELNLGLQNALARIEEKELKDLIPLEKKPLTEFQQKVYDLKCKGYNQPQSSKILGKSISLICRTLQSCKKKGYIGEEPLENEVLTPIHPNKPTPNLNFVTTK